VQLARLPISADGIVTLNVLPPTTWCMCGEGAWPGFTRLDGVRSDREKGGWFAHGSIRSITS